MEKFLKEITKEAGEKLLKWFRKNNYSKTRGTSKEVVTKYDKIIDKFLIGKIRDKFPEHNLLTEESGEIKGKSNYRWIIDSLDGSGNFANGNPLFSVCAAVLKDGLPLMSAIYHPFLEEFYFARRNGGAFLGEERINVSPLKKLKNSYIVYCEGNAQGEERIKNIFGNFYEEVKDIRKIGSAGVETAWIAVGRADGYFTTQIDPWDVAAGVLLVEEAGGMATDFKGDKWKSQRADLVFSNGALHSEILNKIKK